MRARELGALHPADELAAYALGALDMPEAEALRRHLQTCPVCQDELASLQQIVNELPLTVPARRAPRSLRRELMRQAAQPALAHPAPPGDRPRSRFRTWLRAPALALGAAVAAVAIWVGVDSATGPGAQVFRAQVVGHGSAELRVAGGHGKLIVHGFAPPPAGQIYEIWVKRPGRAPAPTSALFSVTASGNRDVGVPGSLHRVAQVMVTPEPAGGTAVPTHPAVISISLS